jgi:opacity protein-like surface antigen
MKKTLLLATLAAVIASPAFAQQSHRQVYVPQWNTPAAQAYGQATRPYQSQIGNPRGDVYVNGIDQGTDPDARVRQQLLRDPPHGG